ncbi:MAG: holo-ACP synthase [Cardiobacteriaceae bacterium]|nr:holo-ACP synthase [Cardiobacteriaceae bacterium]
MIGIDMVDKRRIATQWQTYGLQFAKRVLHPEELEQLQHKRDVIRFIASRWAAKEALGKALGTGLRNPVLMPHIHLKKHPNGAPYFDYAPPLKALLEERQIAHIWISISDEKHYTIAYAHCSLEQSALRGGSL